MVEKVVFRKLLGIILCSVVAGGVVVFCKEGSTTEQSSSIPDQKQSQDQPQELPVSQNSAVVTSHYCCNSLSSEDASLHGDSLEIIVHRDPRMPTIVASFVFDVGTADAPVQKNGITKLIAANMITKDMRKKFRKVGIDCNVTCNASYTEVLAFMHPKRLKKFFGICGDIAKSISIDPETLEIQKRRMLIAEDLASSDKDNVLPDNVSARYIPQSVFNEEALKSITVADVKQFFEENYKNRVVLINLCGATDWVPTLDQKKRLLERYHNSSVSKKSISHYRVPQDVGREISVAPNIRIESKHTGNSLGYLYLVKDRKDKQLISALLDLMDYEMFRYFSRGYSAVSSASIGLIFSREDEVLSVSLAPRMDISLRELKRLYRNFIRKFTKVALGKGVLQKVAQRKKVTFDVLLGDLSAINTYITSTYISNTFNERFYPHNAVAFADPEELRELAEKILLNQVISTWITRYRPDR